MFCNQCGKQINDNSKFCYSCGARVDQNSPNTSLQQPREQNNVNVNNQPYSAIQQQNSPYTPYNQSYTQYNQGYYYNNYPQSNNVPSPVNYTVRESQDYNQEKISTDSGHKTFNSYYPDELQADKLRNDEAYKDRLHKGLKSETIFRLFSSPLFIIYAAFAGISLIVSIFKAFIPFYDFGYILSGSLFSDITTGWLVSSIFTAVMNFMLVIGLTLLIIGAASRTTPLSQAALTVITIYAYINFGVIIALMVSLLFLMDTFLSYDKTTYLFIALYVALPLSCIIYKRIDDICRDLKYALYNSNISSFVGVSVQIILSIFVTFSFSLVLFDFTVLFFIIQSILLIVFLFILKVRTN